MTKFHINKHGVPASCKAKPGNCPLGGDETHFDNIEEAQAAADKINESKHGFLPSVNDAEVNLKLSEDSEAYMFGKSYANHGYLDVGIHVFNMSDEQLNGLMDDEKNPLIELRSELEKKMPEVIKANSGTVIPDYNAKDYFRYHVVTRSSDNYDSNDHYLAMAKTAGDINPDYVSTNEDDEVEIDYKLEESISEFAAKRSIEESNLAINDKKYIIGTYDDRNWAEEYFEDKGLL